MSDRRGASDLLFERVRLLDPASGRDEIGSMLVRGGRIVDLGADLGRPDGVVAIDGDGAVLCPGLVDMRAALGEPGFEYRETIASAALAAAAGGITTLAALPDSQPAIDDPALVHLLATRGEETGSLSILPYAAVTRGCRGEELAEIGLLCEAGAVAFTDGARAIGSARLMRLALSYAQGFGALIVQHPEEPSLAEGGAATSGELATRLGLPSIPAAAEAIMVARDIRLAQLTGGRVHFAHVSTQEALALIRRAKEDGIAVTCDTAPPYFDLNETAIGNYRTYAKLSPPLRTESDRVAVAAALVDGTIDAIASDHQPRDADDKRLPFAQASPGGSGLATLLGITLAQVHGGSLPLARAVALLTSSPSSLLASGAGTLAKGAPADLCLFHPERVWQVVSGELPGKAQNTPFDGRALEGTVIGDVEGRATGVRMSFELETLIALLAAIVVGYLLGSVPFGLLLTRAAGLGDIRAIGSGNIGATNVLRTGRRGLAAATLVLDAAKGAMAVWVGWRLGGVSGEILGGLAAMLGHLYPAWLRFRGGKGVATGFGVLLAASPLAGLLGLLVWLLVARLSRFSSAAALAAFALAPVLVAVAQSPPALLLLAGALAVLVFFRHGANIRRLLSGTEPRIGETR